MTRPRPSVGPALAGAIDLSALKQPPPTAGGGAAPTAPAGGVEITEANLEAELIVRSGQIPVVVLLWTPRSPSSVQLADALAALAKSDGGKWSLGTVNVDASPEVARMFGAEAVPTVIAFAAGQPLSSFQGSQPPEQLRRWIDSLLEATAGKLTGGGAEDAVEEVDPELARARAFWDDGELDSALEAYQSILDAKPSHAEAKDALRQIAFVKRATTRSADSVALADASPDDLEAAFAAADLELWVQDADAAFARLIALVRRTAGDERTTVRTRLIELFELLAPDDPRVVAGRRNLANALY